MGVNSEGIEELTPERLATARRLRALHEGPLEFSMPVVCAWCLRAWGANGCPDRRWSDRMIDRAQNERIARVVGHAHA